MEIIVSGGIVCVIMLLFGLFLLWMEEEDTACECFTFSFFAFMLAAITYIVFG